MYQWEQQQCSIFFVIYYDVKTKFDQERTTLKILSYIFFATYIVPKKKSSIVPKKIIYHTIPNYKCHGFPFERILQLSFSITSFIASSCSIISATFSGGSFLIMLCSSTCLSALSRQAKNEKKNCAIRNYWISARGAIKLHTFSTSAERSEEVQFLLYVIA